MAQTPSTRAGPGADGMSATRGRAAAVALVIAMAAAAVAFGAYTTLLAAWFAKILVATQVIGGEGGAAWLQATGLILTLVAVIGVIVVPVAAAIAVYRRATRADLPPAAGEGPADAVKNRVGTRRNITALLAAAAAAGTVIGGGGALSQVLQQRYASITAMAGPAGPGIEADVINIAQGVIYGAAPVLSIIAAVAVYIAIGGSTWRGVFALERVAVSSAIVCCCCLAGLIVGFFVGLFGGELEPEFLIVSLDVFGTLGVVIGVAIVALWRCRRRARAERTS